MEPRDAYSVKILGEPLIYGESVFFTMKWVEVDEYKSSIFVLKKGKNEPERLTFGGRERSPLAGPDYLYYIKSGENSESLMIIRNSSEPRELVKLKKIEKYERFGQGLLLTGVEEAPDDKPFTASRLNYRFDGRGLIRNRKSLFIFGEKLEKILSGDYDVTDLAVQDEKIWVTIANEGNDAGLSDIYEVDQSTRQLTKVTSGKGIVNSMVALPDGDIAYSGHREGVKPWAQKKLFPGIKKEPVSMGKYTGNGSVISDLFLGSKERMFWDDGLYCCGQNGGTTSLYKYTDRKIKEIVTGEFTIQDFHVENGKIAYIYSSQEKPSVLSDHPVCHESAVGTPCDCKVTLYPCDLLTLLQEVENILCRSFTPVSNTSGRELLAVTRTPPWIAEKYVVSLAEEVLEFYHEALPICHMRTSMNE